MCASVCVYDAPRMCIYILYVAYVRFGVQLLHLLARMIYARIQKRAYIDKREPQPNASHTHTQIHTSNIPIIPE